MKKKADEEKGTLTKRSFHKLAQSSAPAGKCTVQHQFLALYVGAWVVKNPIIDESSS
jgi:hypothetical protein